MAIFPPPGTAPTSTPHVVDAVPVAVYVAALTAGGESPTWDAFTFDPRLQPVEVYRGSSIAGPSRATIRFVPLPPDVTEDPPETAGDTQSVEEASGILKPGDRVMIAVMDGEEGTPRPIWMGYCVKPSIKIDGSAEDATWACLGPEWIWGADGVGSGSGFVIAGQARRTADGDEGYISGAFTSNITPYDKWDLFEPAPSVFNPGGRANMTDRDIELDEATPPLLGRIFEEPDRRTAGNNLANLWTVRQALKFLFATYSLSYDGIDGPADWTTIAVPSTAVLRSIDVEGMGLWSALRAVCGPDYGFYVTTVPASGTDFAGFSLVFFSACSTSCADANLHLAPRLSSPTAAIACVARLDATKDITKVVNTVSVYGTELKHVCLRYHGHATPTMDVAKRPLALQHGWIKSEGDLNDYCDNEGNVTYTVLDSLGKLTEWNDRYVTSGKDFPKYRHVFRLFTWNEAREWYNAIGTSDPNLPVYYGSAVDADGNLAWYAPDLTGPLSTEAFARRRRPFLDTIYRDTEVDTYRRVRPQVFIAYNKSEDPDSEESLTAWKKIPSGCYELDKERGALWITKERLDEWLPFMSDTNPIVYGDFDDTSFASLLATGRLRLAIECSIVGERSKLGNAATDATGGTPLVREAVYRRPRDYIKLTSYDDGQGFILSGMPSGAVDDSADALTFAQTQREAGRDAQFHASILVEADWPEQGIGKYVTEITGRGIALTSGTGRAAQIVAQTLDIENLKWELLTESSALALKGAMRRQMSKHKNIRSLNPAGPRAGEYVRQETDES